MRLPIYKAVEPSIVCDIRWIDFFLFPKYFIEPVASENLFLNNTERT